MQKKISFCLVCGSHSTCLDCLLPAVQLTFGLGFLNQARWPPGLKIARGSGALAARSCADRLYTCVCVCVCCVCACLRVCVCVSVCLSAPEAISN